jgi:hypothetical protein
MIRFQHNGQALRTVPTATPETERNLILAKLVIDNSIDAQEIEVIEIGCPACNNTGWIWDTEMGRKCKGTASEPHPLYA